MENNYANANYQSELKCETGLKLSWIPPPNPWMSDSFGPKPFPLPPWPRPDIPDPFGPRPLGPDPWNPDPFNPLRKYWPPELPEPNREPYRLPHFPEPCFPDFPSPYEPFHRIYCSTIKNEIN